MTTMIGDGVYSSRRIIILLLACFFAVGILRAGSDASSSNAFSAVTGEDVDWYKPPPASLDPNQGVSLFPGIVKPVPEPFREECTMILGSRNQVLLGAEQANRFTDGNDPEAILQAKIESLRNTLQMYDAYPINEKDTLKRYDAAEVTAQKRRRLDHMRRLRRQIAQLNRWKGKLKPYLIKAVQFEDNGVFGGTLNGSTLLIVVGHSVRNSPSMQRCPIVAFLPVEPRRIYTAIGGLH